MIHGAPVGKPAANKASVNAVYVNSVNGEETHFTRVIHGSSSDHKVNGKVTFYSTSMIPKTKLSLDNKTVICRIFKVFTI